MRFDFAALIAAFLLASGVATAEPKSPALPSEGATAAPEQTSPVDSDRGARAAELYRDAEAKYVAGDLPGALALMQQCYEVSGHTDLLFNLGQLHQELEQCEPALARYREYLAKSSEVSRRDEAATAIAKLSLECPDQPAPAATSALPQLTPPPASVGSTPVLTAGKPPYWTPLRTVGWSAVAAGVLAGSGAVYFGLRAADDEQAMEQRLRALKTSQAGFDQADKQRENSGERAATWARVLSVSAIGLATVGVTLVVIGAPKQETRTSGLSLELGAGSLSARFSRAF